ncbi:MAG: Uma2 family endonuclease [Pirellulaceae bacterium]
MATHQHATIDDLHREEGKAELVGGEIVRMSPAGRKHGRVSLRIARRLLEHQESTSAAGEAFADSVGFLCDLAHRQSFSPDAAYYAGPDSDEDKFLPQAPEFAVEIRSEEDEDYGPKAEQRLSDKRSDYFTAGTKVVWDVDLKGEDVVRVYRAADPENPTIYRRGDVAEAEPAVRGWTMPVDELFR